MKTRPGEHPRGDLGQMILLAVFLVVWVVDSFFHRVSTAFAVYVPALVRFGLAGLALAAAAYLLAAAHAFLALGPPAGVVMTGPFRFVRHPMYLGTLLFYLGLSLATLSLLSLLALVLIFLFYNHIANYEEKWLADKYGPAYGDYRARTGKWVPNIRTLG